MSYEMLNEDLVEWVVNEALKLGADEAECYGHYSKQYNVNIMAGEVKQPSFQEDAGLGIRVIVNKRLGFAATNVFEREKIREAIKRALSIARASQENPKWRSLPEASKYESVRGIIDTRIRDIDPGEVLEITSNLLNNITSLDKRVIPVWGGVFAGYNKALIANSNNVRGEKEGTIIGGSLGTIARDGNVTTPVHSEVVMSRTKEINFDGLALKLVEKTVKSLTITKIETGDYPVIFDPEALFMLSIVTIIRAISADFVQMGRSPYTNKIGEVVASQEITLIDDGTLPGGIGSTPFDDEGCPTKRTVIIERGVLKRLLYDNYRAKIEDKESTGNGFRGGGGAQPKYLFTPSISPTNIIIEPGKESLETIVSEIEKGVMILGIQGAHASNPETGEVSAVATPAWVIEKGEIKGLAPGIMINMNIYEALRDVKAISKEVRQVYNFITPWIQIEKAKIISK
ncbi:MAG: TldD/PmbA family protein [Candidatus Njordarchaeales archaeon]